MGEKIYIGDPAIEITVKRSARARRYSLRISQTDGQPRLTVPLRADVDAAIRFAMSNEVWLRKHLAKRPERSRPSFGGEVLFEGVPHRLAEGQGRKVVVADGVIHIPATEARLSARLQGFLKAEARDRLAPLSDHYAAMLNRSVSSISLRDTRSRWGSCSTGGRLMYSWRLVMAPPRVLEYVVAHEACHLVEMNHSVRFWDLVHDVFGPHDEERAWLRNQGNLLHQIDFKA